MSGNHTPTPWVYVHESTEYGAGDDDVTFGYLMQEGDEQYHIAPMIVDIIDGRANAEFIVTAVNSYASSQAEIERLRAENATLRAVATKIDADWTEAFPEGPEGDRTYLGGFGTLSDDTVEVWRVIRAALSGSKE